MLGARLPRCCARPLQCEASHMCSPTWLRVSPTVSGTRGTWLHTGRWHLRLRAVAPLVQAGGVVHQRCQHPGALAGTELEVPCTWPETAGLHTCAFKNIRKR